MVNHPYCFNPFCESCVICGTCGVPVNLSDKVKGELSPVDIYRHELNNENHEPKPRELDARRGIVDEVYEQAKDFIDIYIHCDEENEGEMIARIRNDWLESEAAYFRSCIGCKKCFVSPVYRKVRGGHRHKYAKKKVLANAIKGWTKCHPQAVCQSRRLADYLAKVGFFLRKLECMESSEDDLEDELEVDYDTDNYFDISLFGSQTNWSKNCFQRLQRLGKGSFGRVDLVRENSTKGILALKSVKSSAAADAEIHILRRLQGNRNIVRLFDCFKEDGKTYMMLEYLENGSLQDALNELEDGLLFDDNIVVGILLQIVDALIFCHAQDVIHCDIKPDNVLLGAENEIILADFGLSLFKMTERPYEYPWRGSLSYMSPEMLTPGKFNQKTDIWSLGVLLYVLSTGHYPFVAATRGELSVCIKNTLTVDGNQLQFPANFSEDAKDLILKMLVIDPDDRIPLEDVRRHQWIQKVRNTHKSNDN